jgi:beta-glucosidase
VAEIYLTPPQDGLNPKYSLAGFQRIHLAPGEVRHVQFTLDPRQLSYVDKNGVRAVRAGAYSVAVGGAQPSESKGVTAPLTIVGSKELPR